MKTNNKFSSFIGGIVITFVIALIMPTSAQATWNNYNSGTSTKQTQCDTYKARAQRYLNAYYRCYNYNYYRYYVYYMKKYKYCQSTVSTKPDCNKYKNLSDRYLAAYNRCGYSCYYKYHKYYLNLYKKCEASLSKTGKVCGVVYEDINSNEQQDDSETGVANIKVKIIDANGDEHTVVTDNSGKYCQENVLEGSASITVDETTLPTDAELTAGANPNDIDVVANRKNDAGTDGYTLPVPTGSACGYVLIDGKGQEGITVVLLDSEDITHSKVTNSDGKYCFENIPQGTVEVDVDDTTLPNDAELTAGIDPNIDITIVPNIENDAGTVEYTLPVPVGTACGSVLVDDEGESNVTINVLDSTGNTSSVTTDNEGKYCVCNLPLGEAIFTVDISTLPSGAEQVIGENPTTIMIEEKDDNDAKIDGYIVHEGCPTEFKMLEMEIWTAGKNTSDNLQTVLDIEIPKYAGSITFVKVQTGDSNDHNQPHEQFKIIRVDANDNLIAETGYTKDINNVTHEDQFSDLGKLSLNKKTDKLLLVHRADSTYGDDLSYYNSVTFKSLCYKIELIDP